MMDNIMPLRTIRDMKAVDRQLRCGAPALFA
jgi:hypothetical protein